MTATAVVGSAAEDTTPSEREAPQRFAWWHPRSADLGRHKAISSDDGGEANLIQKLCVFYRCERKENSEFGLDGICLPAPMPRARLSS